MISAIMSMPMGITVDSIAIQSEIESPYNVFSELLIGVLVFSMSGKDVSDGCSQVVISLVIHAVAEFIVLVTRMVAVGRAVVEKAGRVTVTVMVIFLLVVISYKSGIDLSKRPYGSREAFIRSTYFGG